MSRLKRIAAALLCAALLLGAVSTASGSASGVYLMAVNEHIVEMTAENMPMVVGGVLYVPYTMLSSRATTINMGVTAQYSTSRRTVLVSSDTQAVIFDTQANTAYDLDNNLLDVRAVVRNTMVYLPIAWICSHFGIISYSLTRTRYGTLVRVTNGSVILSDADFVTAADSMLADNLRRYQESLVPSESPTTAADPSPEPSQTQPPQDGPTLCLAFRWGDRGEELAALLESRGERGLFLFAPEELAEHAGAVRRLAAAGHTLALALSGEDPDACLEQAAEGQRLAARIAHCPALVLTAGELPEEALDALAQRGAVWSADVRGEDYASAWTLIRALSTRRVNRVELACGDAGLALLRSLPAAMENDNCHLRDSTAPSLAALP